MKRREAYQTTREHQEFGIFYVVIQPVDSPDAKNQGEYNCGEHMEREWEAPFYFFVSHALFQPFPSRPAPIPSDTRAPIWLIDSATTTKSLTGVLFPLLAHFRKAI